MVPGQGDTLPRFFRNRPYSRRRGLPRLFRCVSVVLPRKRHYRSRVKYCCHFPRFIGWVPVGFLRMGKGVTWPNPYRNLTVVVHGKVWVILRLISDLFIRRGLVTLFPHYFSVGALPPSHPGNPLPREGFLRDTIPLSVCYPSPEKFSTEKFRYPVPRLSSERRGAAYPSFRGLPLSLWLYIILRSKP